MVKAVE